jgi:dihydrofolate synthase/folylpolyglutamate synthase
LQDFRERIRILTPGDADGRIPPADFVTHINRMRPVTQAIPEITWFELLTAVAFLHFAQQHVDVAVVEVGLGGRLDATNVVSPLVSVITSLSLDHTKFLGNTLTQIAYEKGGIIKPHTPVVVAPQTEEALAELQRLAAERQAPLRYVPADWGCRLLAGEGVRGQLLEITRAPQTAVTPTGAHLELALVGAHQQENALVALAALTEIQPALPQLDTTAVQQGLAQMVWPGRLQLVHSAPHTPTLLVDCAHNLDSAQKLAIALPACFTYQRLHLIFGAATDKDLSAMLTALLPLAHTAAMVTAHHPRSAAPADLVQMAGQLGSTAVAYEQIADALTAVWQQAQPGDLICATGSFYVVGDLLNQWESLQSHLISTRSLPGK